MSHDKIKPMKSILTTLYDAIKNRSQKKLIQEIILQKDEPKLLKKLKKYSSPKLEFKYKSVLEHFIDKLTCCEPFEKLIYEKQSILDVILLYGTPSMLKLVLDKGVNIYKLDINYLLFRFELYLYHYERNQVNPINLSHLILMTELLIQFGFNINLNKKIEIHYDNSDWDEELDKLVNQSQACYIKYYHSDNILNNILSQNYSFHCETKNIYHNYIHYLIKKGYQVWDNKGEAIQHMIYSHSKETLNLILTLPNITVDYINNALYLYQANPKSYLYYDTNNRKEVLNYLDNYLEKNR